MVKEKQGDDSGYEMKPEALGNYSYGPYTGIPGIQGHFQTNSDAGSNEVCGWFLGPKAENQEVFSWFINQAVDIIAYGRKSFHPEDPSHITEEIKHSPGYLAAMQSLRDNFFRFITFLDNYSIPFSSMRYQGHMLWDLTLPSLIGYFTEMLQNSNNVSVQASTATILLEKMVTEDICNMIAYQSKNEIKPWGHITCDGSVANMESMWSTRELKYMSIGIKAAILSEPNWGKAKDIVVALPNGKTEYLINLDNWQLINLTCDEILSIPKAIAEKVYEDEIKKAVDNEKDEKKKKQVKIEATEKALSKVWSVLKSKYSLNSLGISAFSNSFCQDLHSPAVIVPSSKHYSWPKSASVLGLGSSGYVLNNSDSLHDLKRCGMINVTVDESARMDLDNLKAVLEKCVAQKKPVLMVVAVIGSTEESAVDPLEKIIEMRNDFRKNHNFDFNIHCDAAWGGYVTAVIRKDYDLNWPETENSDLQVNKSLKEEDLFIPYTKCLPLSKYVYDQYTHLRYSDSITIDPHKMGYVPYPAGTISYRNKEITNLVTYSAPYIGGGDALSALGQSGIEGSRPGAAAAALFLSHSVIRPSVKGHGKIVACSLENSNTFLTLIRKIGEGYENKFKVIPLQKEGEIADINIVDYVFNFCGKDGKANTNTDKFNSFNKDIFDCLNIKPGQRAADYDLLITMTTFNKDDYGEKFVNALKKRIGLPIDNELGINFLRSVIMDPYMADDPYNFFENVIIPVLRKTVLKCVEKYQQE